VPAGYCDVRLRYLRISFAPLARSEVIEYLRTNQGMTGDEVEFLAAMSMGSIGAALGLDKEAFVEKRRAWVGMVEALKGGDYRAAIDAAEALAGNRGDALKFLAWAQSWYRDLLVYGVTGDSGELVNLDMREQIAQQAVPAKNRAAHRGTDREPSRPRRRSAQSQSPHGLEKYLLEVVKGQ
jgi:hypothetical protein